MSTENAIHDSIDDAAETVGSVWPIHSFVTANPLAGFEDRPFEEAVAQAADILGGRGYPSPETFAAALERGQIDRDILEVELAEAGYEAEPETLLDRMDGAETNTDDPDTVEDRVDHVLTKWLSAFLDEGRAHWALPDRDLGFYGVFRKVSNYDSQIPDSGVVADLPATPTETIETVLDPYPQSQWGAIFEAQLAALPGWTGFIKQRAVAGDEWQSRHPISLSGYLAVRLAVLDAFDADLAPSETPESETHEVDELSEAFLTAWEGTYCEELVGSVSAESQSLADAEPSGRPDAQLVFCIDTRSEVLRRHLEDTGDYETHGYAGFFGIPMEYEGYDAEVSVEACPPILDAQHTVTDEPVDTETQEEHDHRKGIREAAAEIIETIEANAATAYGFVESAGSGYGLALASRTLVPGRVHDFFDGVDQRVPDDHEFCSPSLDGFTLDEQVEYAATAFDLMGWDHFARLVVFTGHASETANNPFDSSLDCGACAGNPGGPSARVLAKICNDDAVQAELRERGFEIPDDTVFLAGEHNTTTDEVDLYDGTVPESHADELEALRADLETAREGAAAERTSTDAAVRETERRAADWAETRPEWGLAGNAGFVIGPSELAAGLDLDGRAFLHSYDWTTDTDGDALEAIIAGPMVVTQWINCQYYFSTVDTAVYGSGSKITHNPVGNVGVYQGNGGDLMTGLPLQSLMAADDEPYHQPLRLSTVIQAPVDTVTDIIADHENVAGLLDNGWLSLTVVDPTQGHAAFEYAGELSWSPADGRAAVATPDASAAVADD
ncbi:DUF2309 domain-containing protein [Halobacteriales archaeon QS_6_64_34]|nr:MAG: DUF2309 domain-containing protein [Halobacteriales archaeon QS_6_64_34]